MEKTINAFMRYAGSISCANMCEMNGKIPLFSLKTSSVDRTKTNDAFIEALKTSMGCDGDVVRASFLTKGAMIEILFETYKNQIAVIPSIGYNNETIEEVIPRIISLQHMLFCLLEKNDLQ